MTYIPSNVEAKEYFKYFCEDVNAIQFYEEIIEEKENHEKENKGLHREIESLREQLYFARELISEIEYRLEKSNRLNEFKKEFKNVLSESFFEC